MKRRRLQNFLNNTHAEDLRELVADAIPPESKSAGDARTILADAVEAFQAAGNLDPAQLYHAVCSSSAAQLAELVQGRPSARLSSRAIAAAQVILTDVLTSRAGRPATTGLSRAEQFKASRARQRERAKGVLKRLDIHISQEAAHQLEEIQHRFGYSSQVQTVEMVLDAAFKGEILTPPET